MGTNYSCTHQHRQAQKQTDNYHAQALDNCDHAAFPFPQYVSIYHAEVAALTATQPKESCRGNRVHQPKSKPNWMAKWNRTLISASIL